MVETRNKKIINLTAKSLLKSLLIVVLWFMFWFGARCLLMINVPIFSDWLTGASTQQDIFIILMIWITVVCLAATGLWQLLMHDYSFLKIKNKWDIIPYVIPMILCVIILLTKSTVYGVNVWIYILAMIITNFVQDFLTTGLLQTALTKTIGAVFAAILTCIIFFLGHVIIPDAATFTPIMIVMIMGFVLFSWLRYKRGNIYLANVIHLCFALVMTMLG